MLAYLNTKAKPFVVFLFALLSVVIMIASTYAADVLICGFENVAYVGLAISLFLMLLAIPFHSFAKQHNLGYVISWLLNAVGVGAAVATYYISTETSVQLYQLVFASIPSAALLVFVYLMLQVFSKTKKQTLLIATLLLLVFAVISVVEWIKTGSVMYSFRFFALLETAIELCVFGVTVNHDERSVLRDISFGGFGALIITVIVVAVILSEGDVVELGDLDIEVKSKKEKKNNKK